MQIVWNNGVLNIPLFKQNFYFVMFPETSRKRECFYEDTLPSFTIYWSLRIVFTLHQITLLIEKTLFCVAGWMGGGGGGLGRTDFFQHSFPIPGPLGVNKWYFLNVSVNSKPDHNPLQALANILNWQILPSPGHKESAKPRLLGQKKSC